MVKVESPQPTEFIIKGDQKNSYFNFVVDDIGNAHQQFKQNGIVTTEIGDFGGMKFLISLTWTVTHLVWLMKLIIPLTTQIILEKCKKEIKRINKIIKRITI